MLTERIKTEFNLERADSEILGEKKISRHGPLTKYEATLPKYGRCDRYLDYLTKRIDSYSGNDNSSNINVTSTGLYGLEEGDHKYRE